MTTETKVPRAILEDRYEGLLMVTTDDSAAQGQRRFFSCSLASAGRQDRTCYRNRPLAWASMV